jgi:hypothetical protein
MHPYAERAVRRVLESGGVIPLPDAFDDLAELERLAQAISKRPEADFDAIEPPIYINGVAFHPPTLGVIAWARRVQDWFRDEPEIGELALLYGLTVARSKEYRDLLQKEEARKAVHRWALRNRITVASAREVLALYFPAPPETARDVSLKALRLEHGDDAAKWPDKALRDAVRGWLEAAVEAEKAAESNAGGKSLAFLCAETFGPDVDYWLFEASLQKLLAAAEMIAKRNEQEAEAEQKAHGIWRAPTWAVEAQSRFNVFARAFERKYSRAGVPSEPDRRHDS